MNKYLKILTVFCAFGISIPVSAVFVNADEKKPANVIKKQDVKKLFDLNVKEVEKGNINAIYNMGIIFRDGSGAKKDLKEALKWFEKAMLLGDNEARFNAGKIYDLGAKNVKQDLKKAAEYYLKAAEGGFVSAQRAVASMYASGDGIQKDPKKSINWYFKAAGSGDHESQYAVGAAYATGTGVKKNYAEAHYWFNEAANRGNILSLYNLGTMYAKGQGTKKDLVQALKWLELAKIGGYKKAEKNIAFVKKSLKEPAIKEAEQMSKIWLARFRAR